MKKVRSQPRIKGVKRIPSVSSLLPDVRWAVEREKREYGVSMSWITMCALASWFGMDAVAYYQADATKPRRKGMRLVKGRKTA